jgi:hypothetical protein
MRLDYMSEECSLSQVPAPAPQRTDSWVSGLRQIVVAAWDAGGTAMSSTGNARSAVDCMLIVSALAAQAPGIGAGIQTWPDSRSWGSWAGLLSLSDWL